MSRFKRVVHLVGLQHYRQLEQLLDRRGGKGVVLFRRKRRQSMAGLRCDYDISASFRDHFAEFFGNERGAVEIDLEDGFGRNVWAQRGYGRRIRLMKWLIQVVLWQGVMAILLFVPAGTINWTGAWIFLIETFVVSVVFGLWLARHDPALLKQDEKFSDKPKLLS